MYFKSKKSEFIHKIFLAFILIQPFLDVLTGLSLRLTESQFSFSLVVRALFILVSVIYLFFFRVHSSQKKIIIYFLIFAVFLMINLGINYIEKPQFYLLSEVKFIFKTIYFIVIFFLYGIIIDLLKNEGYVQALRYIGIAVTIYSAIIFIAGITGTAFPSYKYQKLGHVGWFYASNEIGVILAMGLPIVLLLALRISNLYWVSVFLVVYSLFAIGTKVGYLSILFTLFLTLVFVVKDFILNHRKIKVNFSAFKIVMVSLYLVGSIMYTPFAPITKNMNIHLTILETKKGVETGKSNKTEEQNIKKETKDIDSEEISNLVYSGRTGFLQMYKEFFKKASLSQKLFGMGYGGNFDKNPKMIEMDFHDIFYSFGIIGFLIYIFPIIYFIYKILKEFTNRFFDFFRYENVLIVASCILGLGIAFMAGHVLTAPSVSYFLAILMSCIIVKYKKFVFRS